MAFLISNAPQPPSESSAVRVRSALRRCHQQALGQCLEVKPTIEAVGESTETLRCTLSEAKAVVTVTQTGLEVSQHRVDPLQLGHIACSGRTALSGSLRRRNVASAGSSKPCRMSASIAELMMSAGSVRARAALNIVASARASASGPHETILRRLRIKGRCRYSVRSGKVSSSPDCIPMRRAMCSMTAGEISVLCRNRPIV